MTNNFYKKRVLVIGLGDTGQSVLQFLVNQNCVIRAIDTRTNVEGLGEIKAKFKDVEFITGQIFPESITNDIELIVISPGVSLKESYVVAALVKGIPVIGDIEIFAQVKAASAKVIGITGSNGKTTVTSLVGELLKASGITTIVAGNIGTLQAGYTDFHYLRDIWKRTTEKDALIGVGMTGIGSGVVLGYDMKAAAIAVKEENERVANLIGINKAARTTTVKPSGTSSLVLGTSSGIHAWRCEAVEFSDSQHASGLYRAQDQGK